MSCCSSHYTKHTVSQADNSDDEVDESSSLFSRALRNLSRDVTIHSNHGDFPSYTKQRQAIFGLICAECLASVANHIFATWIPFMMVLYEFAFVTPTTENNKEESFNFKRLAALPIACAMVNNLSGVTLGLLSDAYIRKTKILAIGTLLTFLGTGYLSAMVIEASGKFNCTLESFSNKSEADCVIEHLDMTGGIEPVVMYTVAVLILSGFNAVWRTTIPALAGDQVRSRAGASRLYLCYFWFWKLGDSALTYYKPGITNTLSQPEIFMAKFSYIALCFAIIGLTCSALSTSAIFTVILASVTREPRADVSAIKDCWGIWTQAIQRRGYRRRGHGFLSTATHSNGGDYPQSEVEEVTNLGKFFLIVLCISPLTFICCLTQPTTITLPNNTTLTDMSRIAINEADSLIIVHTQIAFQVCVRITSLLSVTLYPWISNLLLQRCGTVVRSTHRIVAGQICIIIATAFGLLTTVEHNPMAYTAYALQGVSLALIFTAGFELALVTAPRSLQTTAMGILFIPDGIANILTLITQNYATDLQQSLSISQLYELTLYSTHIPSLVLNIACLVFVVLMHRKFASSTLRF